MALTADFSLGVVTRANATAERRFLRRCRGFIAMLLVATLASCRWMTASLPANARAFQPPAVYARWWALTEACSGRSGDMGTVRWYRVASPEFQVDGQQATAYWGRRDNRIVLADDLMENGTAVRHEMLHALLRERGHPRAQFLGACASVLDCPGSCITDGGAWRLPQLDYLVLPPDSLDVYSEARLLPREADGERWVSLLVAVRNRRALAIVVAAPGDRVTPATFSYELRGAEGGLSGSDIATDSSQLYLLPYETKSRLFEFRVASDLTPFHVPPGSHLLRGGYAGLWSAYDTVDVTR